MLVSFPPNNTAATTDVYLYDLQTEMAALRDDVAPSWLKEPLSLEETAEKYVRPQMRNIFVDLCRQPVSKYLDRSALLSGMDSRSVQ